MTFQLHARMLSSEVAQSLKSSVHLGSRSRSVSAMLNCAGKANTSESTCITVTGIIGLCHDLIWAFFCCHADWHYSWDTRIILSDFQTSWRTPCVRTGQRWTANIRMASSHCEIGISPDTPAIDLYAKTTGCHFPANEKYLYSIDAMSKTLVQRCLNVIQMFCVCWVAAPWTSKAIWTN